LPKSISTDNPARKLRFSENQSKVVRPPGTPGSTNIVLEMGKSRVSDVPPTNPNDTRCPSRNRWLLTANDIRTAAVKAVLLIDNLHR
jgi:hypothetical protein